MASHPPPPGHDGGGAGAPTVFVAITDSEVVIDRLGRFYARYLLKIRRGAVETLIPRRYKQFRDLHAKLVALPASQRPPKNDLPRMTSRKWGFGVRGDVIEKRRRKLTEYLTILSAMGATHRAVAAALEEFYAQAVDDSPAAADEEDGEGDGEHFETESGSTTAVSSSRAVFSSSGEPTAPAGPGAADRTPPASARSSFGLSKSTTHEEGGTTPSASQRKFSAGSPPPISATSAAAASGGGRSGGGSRLSSSPIAYSPIAPPSPLAATYSASSSLGAGGGGGSFVGSGGGGGGGGSFMGPRSRTSSRAAAGSPLFPSIPITVVSPADGSEVSEEGVGGGGGHGRNSSGGAAAVSLAIAAAAASAAAEQLAAAAAPSTSPCAACGRPRLAVSSTQAGAAGAAASGGKQTLGLPSSPSTTAFSSAGGTAAPAAWDSARFCSRQCDVFWTAARTKGFGITAHGGRRLVALPGTAPTATAPSSAPATAAGPAGDRHSAGSSGGGGGGGRSLSGTRTASPGVLLASSSPTIQGATGTHHLASPHAMSQAQAAAAAGSSSLSGGPGQAVATTAVTFSSSSAASAGGSGSGGFFGASVGSSFRVGGDHSSDAPAGHTTTGPDASSLHTVVEWGGVTSRSGRALSVEQHAAAAASATMAPLHLHIPSPAAQTPHPPSSSSSALVGLGVEGPSHFSSSGGAMTSAQLAAAIASRRRTIDTTHGGGVPRSTRTLSSSAAASSSFAAGAAVGEDGVPTSLQHQLPGGDNDGAAAARARAGNGSGSEHPSLIHPPQAGSEAAAAAPPSFLFASKKPRDAKSVLSHFGSSFYLARNSSGGGTGAAAAHAAAAAAAGIDQSSGSHPPLGLAGGGGGGSSGALLSPSSSSRGLLGSALPPHMLPPTSTPGRPHGRSLSLDPSMLVAHAAASAAAAAANHSAAAAAALSSPGVDSPSSSSMKIEIVHHRGVMWKQGGFRGGRKSWKSRYFELKDRSLYYFRTSRPVLLGTMAVIEEPPRDVLLAAAGVLLQFGLSPVSPEFADTLFRSVNGEQEAEAARQQAVLDSLQRQGAREDGLDPMDADGRLPGGAEAGAEDADLISGSVARLALDAEPQPPSTDDLAEAVLPQALEPEQVEELRRQLDERLKTAAAGALDAAASADPSLQRYGAEVWSRCEALTAGLASELTEQLRLILEPTLASKMAGDFKTGVRAMIECGVGFAAAKGA